MSEPNPNIQPVDCPNTPRPRRNWLTRLLFGDFDNKFDVAIKALEENTKMSAELRKDLQKIAETSNPLARLVHNLAEARRQERESGMLGNN